MRNRVGAVKFLGSFLDELPRTGRPEVAFVGRSNVGKSSAINCLLGSKSAARVSRTPGRTQMINLFDVGGAVVFADLPGYGYADVPDEVQAAWKPSIERYLGTRDDLRLVVLLVDLRREPQPMDGQLLYALMEADVPALVVGTKADKLKKQERARALAALQREFRLEPEELLAFSSVTREGRDAVWDRIEAACRAEGP